MLTAIPSCTSMSPSRIKSDASRIQIKPDWWCRLSDEHQDNLLKLGMFEADADQSMPTRIVPEDTHQVQREKIQAMENFMQSAQRCDLLCDALTEIASEIYVRGQEDRDTLDLNITSHKLLMARKQKIRALRGMLNDFKEILYQSRIGKGSEDEDDDEDDDDLGYLNQIEDFLFKIKDLQEIVMDSKRKT